MTECRIPERSISMLVGIKQALLADNELCNKVCKLGKLAMANYPNKKLTSNPYYIDDYDDDFDTTYAYYEFAIPKMDGGADNG